MRLLCADSLRTTMIVMAVQKDTCFPTLLWLLEITTLLVTVLFKILAFTPDDSALPQLPNLYIQGNCSSIKNLPLYIDFLLVCVVTFSTVCLLLYDQLTLLISYDGSVCFLASIWMFLMATAVRKFIIIRRSLPQTNNNPFSVLSIKVRGGWCARGVLEQRFLTHNLSSKRIGEHTCYFPGHCKFTTHFNSQTHFQRFGKLPSSPRPPPKRWKWFCERKWVVNLQCPGNEHVCSPILFELWSCRMPHRYFVQSFLCCQFSDWWFLLHFTWKAAALLRRLAKILMNAGLGIAEVACGRNSRYWLFMLHPFRAPQENPVT